MISKVSRLKMLAITFSCISILFPNLAWTNQEIMRLESKVIKLPVFIEMMAKIQNKTYLLPPDITGEVTIVGAVEFNKNKAHEILKNVLAGHGLTEIENGSITNIVREDDNRVTRHETLRQSFGTRILKVNPSDAPSIASLMKSILSKDHTLHLIGRSGLIFVTDRPSKLIEVEDIIEEMRQLESAELSHKVIAIPVPKIVMERAQNMIENLAPGPNGSTANFDQAGSRIVVSGTAEYIKKIEKIVEVLSENSVPEKKSLVISLQYADATAIANIFNDVNSAIVRADIASNSIYVNGSADDVSSIQLSIGELDIQPQQVLIEAIVFEVSDEAYANLSVQFGAVLNGVMSGTLQASENFGTPLTSLVSSFVSGTGQNIGTGLSLGGATRYKTKNALAGLLEALSRESSVKLLSTPSITALNNKTAEIVVGQNVPFVTGSFATVGDALTPEKPFQTIERRDIGLSLTVTPQITANNTIRLQINQEVSNLTNSASAAGGEITAKRKLKTNIMVEDGKIILLGGLSETSNSSHSEGLPNSRSGSKSRATTGRQKSAGNRVLMIMLRPQIINDGHKGEVLARLAKDSVGQKSGQLDRLFDGKANWNSPSFEGNFKDTFATRRQLPSLPPRIFE